MKLKHANLETNKSKFVWVVLSGDLVFLDLSSTDERDQIISIIVLLEQLEHSIKSPYADAIFLRFPD